MNNKKFEKINKYFIFFIIISFVAGFIGGALGSFYSSNFIKASLASLTGNNQQTLKVEEESATTLAVEKVGPAVVSIIITKDLSQYYNQTGPNASPLDDFFNFGFPFEFNSPDLPQGEQVVGGGTGFIISADGLILTNKHVVEDTEAKYSVLLSDGTEHDAKVIGRDPTNDIAVVKIESNNLPVVELGDSDTIKIGQTVIAIGYALGEYSNTVTKGVVSGLGRNIIAGSQLSSEKLEGVIQTDAAINPGNSGGPLINIAGQVIGINTAINREGQLIGFAIPINSAKSVIDSVIKYGRIIRPYLGVRYIPLTQEFAEKNNLSVDYGALIVRGSQSDEPAITAGSPADKAGLAENDIILEIDGTKITEENTLAELISQHQVGDQVSLKILHDGQEKEITVTLEEFPQ